MKKQLLQKQRGIFLALLSFLCVISIQAQTWTAPVPVGSVMTNGSQYYVYSIGAKAFIDRGGQYDTQAIVTPSTGSVITTVQSTTFWILQFETSAKCLKHDVGSGWTFTDGNVNTTWTVVETDAVNQVYSIQVPTSFTPDYNASQFLGTSATLYSSNNEGTVYDVRYNRAASDSTKWMFVTATELAKYNAKVQLDKYMSIAKYVRSIVDLTSYISTYNAGVTADINTAVTNLKAALTVVDKTSSINNPSFTSTATTGWPGAVNYGWNATDQVLEYYRQNNKTLSQTVTGLPAGVYVVKAQGFQRPFTPNTAYRTAYTNGSDQQPAKLFVTASGTTSFIPLRSLFSETASPQGTVVDTYKFPNSPTDAKAAFNAGLYENELGYVTVDGTGSITFGTTVYYQASKVGEWQIIDNFRLSYYGTTNPTINLSKSSFNLTYSPFNTTFDIVGKYLTGDVTLTAPAGITLTGTNVVNNGGIYTILVANANATNTITATWDQATVIGGNITIGSSNSEFTSETIAVTAELLNTWSGSAWSSGSAPSASNTKAMISGNYNDVGFTCSDLTINAPTTFTTNTAASGNVTLTSTLALGSNTLSLTGNLSASGYTLDGTVSFMGASAQTATATALNNVVVNNATGVTLGGNATVNGTITFTLGDVNTGANTLTLTGATSATGTGYIITGSTGTVAYAGSGAQTISNLNGAVYNLTVNNAAGVTLGEAEALSGTLTLTSGTLTNSNNVTLATGATIICTAGSLDAVPVFGTTVNLTYNGALAQATSYELPSASSVLNNMTVNNGSGVTFSASATVNGTLTLASGTLTNSTNNVTLATGATIVRTAGLLDATPVFGSTVNLTYNGASAQTTSYELPSTSSVLNNMTVNNGSGVTLSAAATVNGILTLTSGNLSTGANTLSLTASGTPVSGSGNIVTGSTGTIIYAGSSALTISNLNSTVYNLTVVNPITATLSGAIMINGNLNLSTATTRLAVSANITLNGDMTGSGYIDGGNATYSFNCSGSSLQHLSAINVYNLTINNAAGVILGKNLNFNSDNGNTNLTLTAGQLDNSVNTISLRNGTTIKRTAGSLTSAPTFGTSVKLVYDGSSAQTTEPEIPVATGVLSNMTVSNPVGVTLNSNAKVNGILTISLGAALSVAAGKQLTATATLTNSGTLNLLSTAADGTATILTPATIGGTGGTVNVQQYLTLGRNWYVSSPVSAATTAALSTATSVVSYDEVHGTSAPWVTENGSLTPMKGYISTTTTTSGAVTFSGTLNTGAQSIALTRTGGQTKEGFNLVGNPYPSYLIWDDVVKNNVGTTIWYRSKSSSAYKFGTYNATSHIGTNLGSTPDSVVTKNIPPMQAFWVRVNAPIIATDTVGSIQLANSMRVHKGTQTQGDAVTYNDGILRVKALDVTQVLRLQVSNGINEDEAIVLFNSNASNGLDDFDSQKMSNMSASIPEIYTTVSAERLVINGLNSVAPNEELPLGFTTGQSNAFSIKATEISNFDAGTKVILKDKLLNTEQDLSVDSTYSFTSDVASTTSRFSIVFKAVGITTGVNKAGDDQALIYKNANNQITVNCKGVISSDAIVSVYNALGQKLESKQITSTTTVIGKTFTSGVYVVTVNNGGKNTTKKVILN